MGCPCRSGCAGAWSDKRWVDKWRGIELTRQEYGPSNPAVLEVVRIHDERAALVGCHCTTKPEERLRAGDRVIRISNQSLDTHEAATNCVAVNHGCRPVTLRIACRNNNK